jgi:RNA polymerase sigma factor (TIGR02999 family)
MKYFKPADILLAMSEPTPVPQAIEQRQSRAVEELLPLVYDELRRLAARQMAREKPGQTLDATALVHEAYLKLAGAGSFATTSQFFRAAAQAMRRVLIDHARAKKADKRGGGGQRFELSEADQMIVYDPDTLLAIDEAIEKLAVEDPTSAELARLRLFAGLSVEEAGESLGLARATAFREWAYARAFLSAALGGKENSHNF